MRRRGDASVPLAHRSSGSRGPSAQSAAGPHPLLLLHVEGARDTSAATVDVFGHGRAATEEEIISQLRGAMIDDLNVKFEGALLHDLVGSPAMPVLPPSVGGPTSSGEAKQSALSALLAMRAKEIQSKQREKRKRASRQIISAYQQQVARLQAALIRQLSDLGTASQRAVEAEMQALMQLGLPAIQHILSDGAGLADNINMAQGL